MPEINVQDEITGATYSFPEGTSDEAIKKGMRTYRAQWGRQRLQQQRREETTSRYQPGSLPWEAGRFGYHTAGNLLKGLISIPGVVTQQFQAPLSEEEQQIKDSPMGSPGLAIAAKRLVVDPFRRLQKEAAQAPTALEAIGKGAASTFGIFGEGLVHSGEAVGQELARGDFAKALAEPTSMVLAPGVAYRGLRAGVRMSERGLKHLQPITKPVAYERVAESLQPGKTVPASAKTIQPGIPEIAEAARKLGIKISKEGWNGFVRAGEKAIHDVWRHVEQRVGLILAQPLVNATHEPVLGSINRLLTRELKQVSPTKFNLLGKLGDRIAHGNLINLAEARMLIGKFDDNLEAFYNKNPLLRGNEERHPTAAANLEARTLLNKEFIRVADQFAQPPGMKLALKAWGAVKETLADAKVQLAIKKRRAALPLAAKISPSSVWHGMLAVGFPRYHVPATAATAFIKASKKSESVLRSAFKILDDEPSQLIPMKGIQFPSTSQPALGTGPKLLSPGPAPAPAPAPTTAAPPATATASAIVSGSRMKKIPKATVLEVPFEDYKKAIDQMYYLPSIEAGKRIGGRTSNLMKRAMTNIKLAGEGKFELPTEVQAYLKERLGSLGSYRPSAAEKQRIRVKAKKPKKVSLEVTGRESGSTGRERAELATTETPESILLEKEDAMGKLDEASPKTLARSIAEEALGRKLTPQDNLKAIYSDLQVKHEKGLIDLKKVYKKVTSKEMLPLLVTTFGLEGARAVLNYFRPTKKDKQMEVFE